MHHKLLRRLAKVLCSMTDHALASALQFLPLAHQKSAEAVHEWLMHAEGASAGADLTDNDSTGAEGASAGADNDSASSDGSDHKDTDESAREEISRIDNTQGDVVIDSDVEMHSTDVEESVDDDLPPKTMEQLFHAVQACEHLCLIEYDVVDACRRVWTITVLETVTVMVTCMWGNARHHIVHRM